MKAASPEFSQCRRSLLRVVRGGVAVGVGTTVVLLKPQALGPVVVLGIGALLWSWRGRSIRAYLLRARLRRTTYLLMIMASVAVICWIGSLWACLGAISRVAGHGVHLVVSNGVVGIQWIRTSSPAGFDVRILRTSSVAPGRYHRYHHLPLPSWSTTMGFQSIISFILSVPLWTICLTLCVAAALASMKRRYAKPGVCPGCGYNLQGNQSSVCPECGLQLNGGTG